MSARRRGRHFQSLVWRHLTPNDPRGVVTFLLPEPGSPDVVVAALPYAGGVQVYAVQRQ